ncbi:hypothetical protein [Rhizobium sp. BK251]|uniref:hypothetical protein n=1 Tax=Rhizobium sp. BK251 TaxID=2512125 RepID=UPI0010445737|nr:hypothetical protein [Rhizobium sp. BK251]TCL76090.1 hypothetical protein EV286_101638 [Rhizobium sp. BK251]
MIIAACTDDPMVEDIARTASEGNHATFGDWYKVFDKHIPDLGVRENLFIVAHGAAFGDENQPVIGSKSNDFYLTARDLNANLKIFPKDYSGGVFVYACLSAVPGAGGLSFVQAYKKIIGPSFPHLTAWGQTGKPKGPLPGPSDKSWTRA